MALGRAAWEATGTAPERQAQACLQSGHLGANHPPRQAPGKPPPICHVPAVLLFLQGITLYRSQGPSWLQIKTFVRSLGPAKVGCMARSRKAH